MELILAEEQRLLRASAERLIAECAAPRPGERAGAARPFVPAVWTKIAEAGWLAILVPESAGGLGLGIVDLCLVVEAAGQAPLVEPIGLAAVAAGALAASESGPDRDRLLDASVSGATIVVPVFDEGGSLALTGAARPGGAVALSGTVAGVGGADQAAGFLVAAESADGPALAWVERAAAGLDCSVVATVDAGAVATLGFADTPARVLAGPNRAAAILAQAYDRLLLAASAELLGAMERAHALALDYTKTRQQFDRPIASFQALQHRAVTDYTEIELTRSLLYQVCTLADEGRLAPGLASAVKARASAAALAVTKSAIQLHGAIGYTSELGVGRYLKRALALGSQHGNDAWHRRRYARLTGLGG